ncbi:putative ribonuclease H-like domain-containing protein, partial [Tanacetum coccineum]
EFDGGYVTFGGGVRGGKIIGKATQSLILMNKKYYLVVTDDYSRFTWVFFLSSKDETSGILKNIITEIENLVDKKVKIIKCDNGTEFKNRVMNEFCEQKGIKREYSVSRTPQQNGVAERRNRILIEAARTMLADSKLPTTFWADAVNTACYVQNRVIIVKPYNKTPYELFIGSEVSIGEGTTSKETDTSQDYIVMPLWKDSLLFDSPSTNVSHDKPKPYCDTEKKDGEGVSNASGVDDQERPKSSTPNINTNGSSINTARANLRTGSLHINTISLTVLTARSNHPQSVSDIISLRDNVTPEASHADLFGDETEMDTSNLNASYHVPTTPNTRIHKDHSLDHVIGDIQSGEEPKRVTKALSDSAWVEAMQEELLQFMLQKIEEEVYVCQHLGFEDPDYPDKVYKVVKALYRLHQAPRAWSMWMILFFGSTKKELCLEFEKLMHDKFQMSSMGELTFFLGLQVKQKEDGIFISQDKYVTDILKKFGFQDVRTASTPMDTEKPLHKDSDGDDVDVHLYRSMIGSLMYLTSSSARSKLWLPPPLQKLSMWLLLVFVDKYSRFRIKCCTIVPDVECFTSEVLFEVRLIMSICSQAWIEGHVGDEAVHKELGDRMERDATTASNLEAKQDSGNDPRCQDNGTTTARTTDDGDICGERSDLLHLSRSYCQGITEASSVRHGLGIDSSVADEAAFTIVDVDARGAATTDIGLEAGQGSGTMHKTSTRPHDLPLLRVYILGSDEDSLQQNKLIDLVTKLTDRVEVLENDMQQTKKVYSSALTKLILRVKKLEKKVKTNKARRSARIVISEDEDVEEDSSKQGRKIFEIDKDPTISLVHPEQDMEYDFDVSIAKGFTTTSVPVTTASTSISTRKDKGKAIMKEDESVQKKAKKELEQERLGHEEAIRLQEQINEEEKQRIARDAKIAKHDPAVLRYHALQNRSFFIAEVRKNMCMYLKNQGGYKQSHFKGTSYEDIRPIFERVWDQNNAFVPKDSEIEKEVMKRPGFDLQQESTQKNEKIKSKQVEEEIVQQEDVVAKQVMIERSKKAGGRLKRKVSNARKDKDKRQKMQDDLEKLTLKELERISKKRTKNEAETTKPDTEWKSVEKTKSRQSPSIKESTKVNPDKSKVKPKATSEEK